jgi:type II restriction/modification system DNA methylase subunit YeeA
VGLLATNSISMVGNRLVLNRIKESGDIFMAWSDRPWTLEGAAVRVSMLGFDDGTDERRVLDGESVAEIHSDLTSDSNVASALPLEENAGICFLGMMKGGPFDITEDEARAMISRPLNPNGRPNSDVVKRRLGGQDVTGRDRRGWIIDFGVNMAASDAALYEWPFEYVKKHVKPLRDQNRRKRTQELWWIHGEARPGLRRALAGIDRCIVTPEVAKHRLFAWIPTSVIPDHKLHVFAREDDFFFGVLHSAIHETWTIATCSWIGKGNDPSYNSDSTFDTFPFPWPPGTEPSEAESRIVFAIAEAARELVRLRDAWLNPPGASEADLKSRTLTNLYNDRPEWLANAHRALDPAVFAAYGWPADLGKQEILSRLLALNHERARKQPAAVVRRKKSDSKPVIEEA